ncbi:hypothetical protein BG58_22285 [Caballeronia jiangsuensis]|nr:hypothetical protein BG58_22285 [Caballeronia jiangsuensis]
MTQKNETAEEMYRAAFERLKEGKTIVLPRGTPVTQNNVAREADRKPDAFKLARYPRLIREIKAYIEFTSHQNQHREKRQAGRHERQDHKAQVAKYKKQRDAAQSKLASAHLSILNLLQENAELKRKLIAYLPPPTPLG